MKEHSTVLTQPNDDAASEVQDDILSIIKRLSPEQLVEAIDGMKKLLAGVPVETLIASRSD